MDSRRFDVLVKSLSSTGTRRGALAGVLASLLGLLGLTETAAERRKHQRSPERKRQQQRAHRNDAKAKTKKRRKVTVEGPCGNGSGKANACEQDKDCCTRLCDQKKGRCRCKKLGEGCKDDRNCCATFGQPMTCQSGSCQTVAQEQALLASPPPPDAPPPPPPDAPPPPPGPGCIPTSCAAQGKNCGTIADGCGGTLTCGPCRIDGQICQSDGTCCLPETVDLQGAINQAAIEGIPTLTLCAGTWNLSSTVVISTNLTLIGAGAGQTILDGGNAVRVLRIAANVTVTLQDLTITKGKAPGSELADFGGGVGNEGTLTLLGVSVTGNSAVAAGGGISNQGGTLTLQAGSSVTGNSAGHSGGGIFNFSGTLTLQSGSSVTGNTAALFGGGIHNRSGGATVTVDSGAIICSNLPLNDQCSGGFTGTGTCPAPSETCPS